MRVHTQLNAHRRIRTISSFTSDPIDIVRPFFPGYTLIISPKNLLSLSLLSHYKLFSQYFPHQTKATSDVITIISFSCYFHRFYFRINIFSYFRFYFFFFFAIIYKENYFLQFFISFFYNLFFILGLSSLSLFDFASPQ